MIFKLCRKCKKPIKHPNVYCPQCLKKVEEESEKFKKIRERKYNSKRDPKYKKFYNSDPWKILKEKRLQDEHYHCERCKKLAVEVHHIKPIQTEEGWPLRLDYENLEALCVKCHNKHHKRFMKKKYWN